MRRVCLAPIHFLTAQFVARSLSFRFAPTWQVLPSFTLEELQTMPISKLKNICLQYGRPSEIGQEQVELT